MKNEIYTLVVEEKPNLMKVGDTIRDVETRNNETTTNASLHKVKDLCRHWDAVNAAGDNFRDYRVHEVLEYQGYERELNDNGSKSEWFKDITLKIVENAIKQVSGLNRVYISVQLRPHQKSALSLMVKADKYFNLLNLAPRFGKTYLILEYAQEMSKKYDNVVLVVASKSLSSNESFENDAKNVKYDFVIKSSSLFKKDEMITDSLEDVSDNANVILVTDEADIASHTKKSLAKLETIKNKLNIIKQISMSGTGIYKADKIIKGGATKENTFRLNVNYTDLLVNSENMVKRNFINIKMDMKINDEILNIRQSFSDSRTFPNLVKYIDNFLYRNSNVNIDEDSQCAMVFVNTETNKNLKNFVREYEVAHPDVHVELVTTSDGHSNRTAQKNIKKIQNKVGNKKLVIFSRQMSSRSFSIPEIDTLLIMEDGLVSNASYQKMSRVLTQNKENTKEVGNIIRISFSDLNLAEEVFLVENESVESEMTLKIQNFFTYNDFTKIVFEDGNIVEKSEISDYYAQNPELFLDQLMKFSDNSKYVLGRIAGLGVEVSGDFNNSKTKSVTKSDKTKGKDKKTNDNKDKKPGEPKEESEDLKMLEKYSEIIVCIPTVAKQILGVDTLDDLTNVSEQSWDSVLPIDRDTFIRNLEINGFKDQIESLYRAYKVENSYTNDKIDQWMSLVA